MGLTGYYAPFDEWPQEVKAEYAYNPEAAKKLLAEAGYPKGFKTNLVASSNDDLALFQILKSYCADIGVDIEIRVMDSVAYYAFTSAGKMDALFTGYSAYAVTPRDGPTYYATGNFNDFGHISDPLYDEMYTQLLGTVDLAKEKELVKSMDMRAIAQHWRVNVLPQVSFSIFQPWFKRYNGQVELRSSEFSWFWVDQQLKKSMGR